MRTTPAPSFALACLISLLCAAPVVARDPAARINAAKRSDFSTEQQAINPEIKSFQQNQNMQDKRFDPGALRDRPMAPEAGRRAAIDLEESRDKNLIEPERKEYDTVSYDTDLYKGQRVDRFQTGEQNYRTALVDRYQESLADAEENAPKTTINKRTTFDSLNRFIFRRNRPEGDDLISAAGSGSAGGTGAASTSAQP